MVGIKKCTLAGIWVQCVSACQQADCHLRLLSPQDKRCDAGTSSGNIPRVCNPKGKRRLYLLASVWKKSDCEEAFWLAPFGSHTNPWTNHHGQRHGILPLSAWITNLSCSVTINCPWRVPQIIIFEMSSSQIRKWRWRGSVWPQYLTCLRVGFIVKDWHSMMIRSFYQPCKCCIWRCKCHIWSSHHKAGGFRFPFRV